MSSLDHKSNIITTIAMVIGGLSLTDITTFVVGLVVLLMAGVSNWFSWKKNKAAFENEKRKAEILKKQNPDEK